MQGPSSIRVHANKGSEHVSDELCLCDCTTFCRVLLSGLSSAQQRQLKVFATRLHKAEVRHTSAISKDAGLVQDAWNGSQGFGLQTCGTRRWQQQPSCALQCRRLWRYRSLAYSPLLICNYVS